MRREIEWYHIEETWFVLCETGRWESSLNIDTLAYIYRDWGYKALIQNVQWDGVPAINWTLFYNTGPETVKEPTARYVVN